ncbi:ribonuclease Z [Tenacibaculum sp. SG-28]|uniref:ribonuclease Z n=1 Tax=Tenacibaculum sp. SG-28 TaxID=754426 RepID=UPI000CF42CCF|nr:ribonuclease Z [Tenacibaculum sp. SG-28]PQJ23166.1 hypothetical protein BSU00_02735 [Tenacibaculum sp. SG-28]
MHIVKHKNYTLVNTEETNFELFLKEFQKHYTSINKNHLIINISSKNNFSDENILLFLIYSELQNKNGKSFVVVSDEANIDNFPEDFNIVPTELEALDIIEMEDIQRDLGFL